MLRRARVRAPSMKAAAMRALAKSLLVSKKAAKKVRAVATASSRTVTSLVFVFKNVRPSWCVGESLLITLVEKQTRYVRLRLLVGLSLPVYEVVLYLYFFMITCCLYPVGSSPIRMEKPHIFRSGFRLRSSGFLVWFGGLGAV